MTIHCLIPHFWIKSSMGSVPTGPSKSGENTILTHPSTNKIMLLSSENIDFRNSEDIRTYLEKEYIPEREWSNEFFSMYQ